LRSARSLISQHCRTAQSPTSILRRFVLIEPGNHPRAG
jgi:hypothetical protein